MIGDNMWFDIIKQGKVLTLPKTSMRIKQPKKEIENKDCNRKLKAYADKLRSKQHDSFRPWMQNREYMALDGYEKGHHKISGWGIDKEFVNREFHQFVAIEQTDFLYDEIPEIVACKLLDMIEQYGNYSDLVDGESLTVDGKEYFCGIYNRMQYLESDWDDEGRRRWVKSNLALACPDNLIQFLSDRTKNPFSDDWSIGDYDAIKGAVFLGHTVEVEHAFLDKGFTAVDIEWK